MTPNYKGGEKNHSLQIPDEPLGNVTGNLNRDMDSKVHKKCFTVPEQNQQTRVQSLSPENKWISPYAPLQEVTEAIKILKTRFNLCMFICNSIDYFTLG
jgi:hypothetical protein